MSRSEEEKAVALKYSAQEDKAPVVIAAGYGQIAERIIDIAEERGIPVFRDDSAASMMCMLQVGTTIPPELYEAVAKIYVEILKVADGLKSSDSTSAPLPVPAVPVIPAAQQEPIQQPTEEKPAG